MTVGAGVFQERDVVAMDCEMVSTVRRKSQPSNGREQTSDAVCRVSIVSYSEERGFETRLDTYVDCEGVIDFRTAITGLHHENFAKQKKMRFSEVQEKVKSIIAGRIVVGHALWNDLEVLRIKHPPSLTRDTALYEELRPSWRQDRLPSLRMLAAHWLHADIHGGQHDPVQDASVALRLYKQHQLHWERALGNRVVANCMAGDAPGIRGGVSGVQIIPEAQENWSYAPYYPMAMMQYYLAQDGGAWNRSLRLPPPGVPRL